jgi:hypothetical protein
MPRSKRFPVFTEQANGNWFARAEWRPNPNGDFRLDGGFTVLKREAMAELVREHQDMMSWEGDTVVLRHPLTQEQVDHMHSQRLSAFSMGCEIDI